MNILLINDLIECGGAEVHVRYEYKILQQHRHNVYMLTFDEIDKYNNFKKEYINLINIHINNKNIIIKVVNKFFINFVLYLKIRKIIKQINPDLIHCHNMNLAPFTQILALRGYKVIQTLHDYSVVCPKGNCIYKKNACSGYKKSCFKCLYEDKGVILKKIRLIILNKIRKIRVNKFISPSKKLCEYAKTYNLDCITINNPVEDIELNYDENLLKEKFNKKIYLYFGQINENKGIFEVLDEIIDFVNKNEDVMFYIVGNAENYYKNLLLKKIQNIERVKYFGKLAHKDVIELLKQIYCVIVPSLWMENYPTTVIEAMQNMCLVIGSDRGGIPEIIGSQEFIFNVMNKFEFSNLLNKINDLDFKNFKLQLTLNRDRINKNNNTNKYYDDIINLDSASNAERH